MDFNVFLFILVYVVLKSSSLLSLMNLYKQYCMRKLRRYLLTVKSMMNRGNKMINQQFSVCIVKISRKYIVWFRLRMFSEKKKLSFDCVGVEKEKKNNILFCESKCLLKNWFGGNRIRGENEIK